VRPSALYDGLITESSLRAVNSKELRSSPSTSRASRAAISNPLPGHRDSHVVRLTAVQPSPGSDEFFEKSAPSPKRVQPPLLDDASSV
jgi:hypothetical protein